MSPRERNMLIGLAVVAVAALAFFLLTLGGEEPEQASAPTPTASPPGVTEPSEPEQEKDEPVQAADFFGGRDPFEPLVVDVGAEATTDDTTAGGTTGETTTGETTTGETTTGDTSTGGTTDDATTGSTTGESTPPEEGEGTDGVTFTGRPVTLIDISRRQGEDVARVQVGEERLTVGEREMFSRDYRLLSISRHCARFRFGDQPFTLCEEVAPK